MLPNYFYHGVRAEYAEAAKEIGIWSYSDLDRMSYLVKRNDNSLAWRDGIYISDFMALPFAWGRTYEEAPNSEAKAGIVVRIEKKFVNEALLRPGQWFLAHHLEKIQHSVFQNLLAPYRDLNDEELIDHQFGFLEEFIDQYASLWTKSLEQTGEVQYKGGFPPQECEFATAPPIHRELFSHERCPTTDERKRHLDVLEHLEFKKV